MSMKVRIIATGDVIEYEDSYAMRLIEQGDAVLVSGDTPPTPQPTPIDPSQYGALITELQGQVADLQGQIDTLKAEATDDRVFANMYQSIAQAEERLLEYDAAHLQEEIDDIVDDDT